MILQGLMVFLFIIGFLLTILSFYSYSKLTNNCTSEQLRMNLRIAICIGSIFMALSVAYSICINKCQCEDSKDWKIYVLLGFMFAMGIYLAVLTSNIKKDFKDCDVDLGNLPDILLWIAIIQVIVIGCGSGIYIYKTLKKDSDKNIDLDIDLDEETESKSGEFSTTEELESEKEEADRQLIEQIKLDIAKAKAGISQTKLKLKNLQKTKRDKKWQDEYTKTKDKEASLKRELESNEKELSEIEGNKTGLNSSFGLGSWGARD